MKKEVWLDSKSGFDKINKLGSSRTPFLFILSYDKSRIFAQALSELDENIHYKLQQWRNYPVTPKEKDFTFSLSPVGFTHYRQVLEHIQEEIRSGNTYLLNLTFKTEVESSFTLEEIFRYAKADFKLNFKGEFICFSPECFIEIQENTISTYPMKGTIDAGIPHARDKILHNEKEMAEHVMIVDLMRNDLGIIAKNINVEKFRYIEKIEAGNKALLQVSSKITAEVDENWHTQIGTLLDKLTPAGSITGTPKKSTVEIINKVEDHDRGFYTGIFGVFDGSSLRSSVMIRFMEKEGEKLFYKSGGGITLDSDAQSEYDELIDKVYLPF